MKILKSSQVSEQRKQVLERKKKQEELRKTFLITREYTIDLFLTGLTALMRQKIIEVGMAANQEPDTIDWEIIPNASSYDDPMAIESHLDDWEDLFEEDLGAEGQTGG